jgi:hypothetical protein
VRWWWNWTLELLLEWVFKWLPNSGRWVVLKYSVASVCGESILVSSVSGSNLLLELSCRFLSHGGSFTLLALLAFL